MRTNLMQLRRLVRARVGVPVTDDFLPDHILDDHINLACQTIDSEGRWPWNEVGEVVTLTGASPDIIPAEDWRSTRAVIHDQRELGLVAPADLLRVFDLTSDLPTVWCPMGDVIAVRAKPAGTIEVMHYYYRECMWLYDDNDSPRLPGAYTGALVAKAAELLATRESSGGDVSRHAEEYAKWVTRMRRETRRSTTGVHVRVRPGNWV